MKKVIRWKNKTAKTEYLMALVSNKDEVPKTYDKDESYELGDYISHFKFGFGFVQKIINHTKVEVFFEDSERVMMQNWHQR